jgi:hypothetical protein
METQHFYDGIENIKYIRPDAAIYIRHPSIVEKCHDVIFGNNYGPGKVIYDSEYNGDIDDNVIKELNKCPRGRIVFIIVDENNNVFGVSTYKNLVMKREREFKLNKEFELNSPFIFSLNSNGRCNAGMKHTMTNFNSSHMTLSNDRSLMTVSLSIDSPFLFDRCDNEFRNPKPVLIDTGKLNKNNGYITPYISSYSIDRQPMYTMVTNERAQNENVNTRYKISLKRLIIASFKELSLEPEVLDMDLSLD